MAEDKVEIAERLGDIWTTADWAQAEQHFWPDAEAQAPEGWPEAEDSKGWPAMQQQFERLKEAWAEDRWEIASTETVDEDTVLQHGHWRGHGRESGLELDLETWIIYRFRDGKVSRMEFYIDRGQAMTAAGL